MNPPTWDGVLLCAILILLFGAIRIRTRRRLGQGDFYDILFWLAIPAFLVVAQLMLLRHSDPSVAIDVVFGWYGVFAMVGASLSIRRLIRFPTPFAGRGRLILANVVSCGLTLFGVYALFYSLAYHLPASYSPDQRDQLRMIRRILEIEPGGWRQNRTIVPLAEAHLDRRGEDLIPDSLRRDGEYQGYRYTLDSDTPTSGLYSLDVTPIQYRPGMPSYHAFPTNPEDKDTLYCVTMVDAGGEPATEENRHFHVKRPLDWIMGRD